MSQKSRERREQGQESQFLAMLANQAVKATELPEQERQQVETRWLATFAALVKRQHGVWIYRRLKWHGFSYRIQPCLEGQEALERYSSQPSGAFYVFNEDMSCCWLCQSDPYPDFTSYHDDVYVAHHNMKWTMAFTHEQPQIGPFFAERQSTGA